MVIFQGYLRLAMCVLAGVFSVVAHADDTAACELNFVAPMDGARDTRYFIGDSEEPLDVAQGFVSAATSYRGELQFIVTQAVNGVRESVCAVRLPGSGNFIVVMVPSVKPEGLKMVAIVLSADPKVFPAGSRRVINLSPVSLRGTVIPVPLVEGAKSRGFALKPMSSMLVPADARGRTYGVKLEYLLDSKWRTLMTSRWFHSSSQRFLIFTYLDRKAGNVLLRGVSDRLHVEPIEETREEDEAGSGGAAAFEEHPLFPGEKPPSKVSKP